MAKVRRVWRPYVTLVALFAVGYLGIVGYARATRTDADDVSHTVTATPTPRAQSATAPSDNTPATPEQSQSVPQPTAESVAKWVADASSNDAKARATAIAALAKAPRAQALPPLKRVLESGDSQVDRPLALQSLRTLAVDQGDADNQIREALRGAVYHGDDDGVVRSAQTTLDEVEQAVSGRSPRAP